MLCGYSSIALLISNRHFHPTWCVFFFFLLLGVFLCFFYTAVTEKPSCLRWSYKFTLQTVFSLWKGETELGLLTAGSGGGGGVWCRLRAGNDGNCSCDERPSKKKKKKARQTWDTWNNTSLIRSCANLCRNSKLICFSPQSDAYIPIIQTTKNQASGHYLIMIS